jgi:hypothetical protein
MRKTLLLLLALFVVPTVLGAECCKLCKEQQCYQLDMSGWGNENSKCTQVGLALGFTSQLNEQETCVDGVIPEFGTIAALVALAGASTAYFVLRK